MWGLAAALATSAASAHANDPDDEASLDFERPSVLQRVRNAHAQFGAVLPPMGHYAGMLGDIVAYSGMDARRYGGSLYTGLDWTRGLFAVRLFGAAGVDEFRTPTEMYVSGTMRASLLPGVRVQIGRLDLKVFFGGDYMLRVPLWPYLDPATEKFGARISLDSWWQPVDRWMLSGAISATTIERGITGRLASGWRTPLAWIGPEVLAIQDIYSSQWRAGGHITGFRFGSAEWSLAGGYSRDSFGRDGAYGRISVSLRPPTLEPF